MATPVRRQYQVFIDRPPQAVFEFFKNLRSYSRILPPEQEITNEAETALREEGILKLRWKQGAVWRNQELQIVEWNPPTGFVEKQIQGPFAIWTHRHKFSEFQTGTLMSDTLEFTLPTGPVGILLDKLYITPHLDTLMNQRQQEAKRLLETVTRIKGRGV
jgi:ligand-binding SRPBCC domain-containing protein